MKYDINMHELEQQRYNAIKEKGKYVELDILIGTEKEEYKGHRGKMPVITTMMHGCGPEEIACLYATLRTLIDYYEKEFPAECLMAKLAMDVTDQGTITMDMKNKKEDDKENK